MNAIAVIAVEILVKRKADFSCSKRATDGSSFLCLEKQSLLNKIETDSGIKLLLTCALVKSIHLIETDGFYWRYFGYNIGRNQ